MRRALPLFKAKITEEDTGMLCVSLVDAPANDALFQKFSEDKELLKFKVEDEDKHIVRGLIMPADYPIYRRNGDFEYYITYEAETLRKMAEKYLKDGFQNMVDTNHNNEFENGCYMVQLFIKDTELGVSPKGFEDYADGSLFAEYHIENEDVWSKIKDGTFRGFSLEGCFNIEETDDMIEEVFRNKEEFTNDEQFENDEHSYEDVLSLINKIGERLNKLK